MLSYLTLVGTTPKIFALDTNVAHFEVAIRVSAGVTVEVALEHPQDSTSDAGHAATGPAPTWVAPPNAANANGVLYLSGTPCSAVRLTPTAGGGATILQQGLRA